MVVMKSGRLMRKIFAAVLSLSLVLASAVSVSAAYFNSMGNTIENADEIQIIGLGGMYDVTKSIKFNAIIPGQFSSLKLYNNGDEIDHGIKNPDSKSNNYYMTLAASDIKYVGENLIRIVATYPDGTTKTGSKMLHAYPKMDTSSSAILLTEQINQDFEGLPEDFNTANDETKSTAIKNKTAKASTVSLSSGNISVTNDEIAGSYLGGTSNKVLKFSGYSSSLSLLHIMPNIKSKCSLILNFNVYLHGNDIKLFDVVFNDGSDNIKSLDLTKSEKDTWHDVAIVWDIPSKIQTIYLDGVKTDYTISATKIDYIRLRTQLSENNAEAYAAIDNLSLMSCVGKLPGLDKIQYYTDNFNTRTDITNGVVPSANAKSLVVALTRGIGGNAREIDRLNADGNPLFNVYKNNIEINDDITCQYRKPSDGSFFYDFTNGSVFEPGKYTVVLTGNAPLVSTPMNGRISNDFYVTGESGILLLPGTQTYDGKTFNYNMEYGITSDKNLLVVAAIYDDNNKLVDVKLIDAPATSHEISGTLDGEGTKAALFVWDKESLKPIDDGVWEVAATTTSAE